MIKTAISQRSSSAPARLAQSVEHETLNLRIVGSSPTLGVSIFSVSLPSGFSVFQRAKQRDTGWLTSGLCGAIG